MATLRAKLLSSRLCSRPTRSRCDADGVLQTLVKNNTLYKLPEPIEGGLPETIAHFSKDDPRKVRCTNEGEARNSLLMEYQRTTQTEHTPLHPALPLYGEVPGLGSVCPTRGVQPLIDATDLPLRWSRTST